MSEASKKKLFVIALFMAFYVLFSFLPLQPWLGEWGFLVLRFVCFTVCAGLLVFFKNRYHWSIDHPNKELRYTFLFPLTIFCFINFFSVPFFKFNLSIEAEDIGLMFMESATDFSASVFEDVLFVNLLIGLLLDLVNWKYKRSFSVLLSAVLLTAAHSYTFLYPGEFPASDPLQVACVQEAFIFLITAGCGYLSMFFDSAVIPVAFHFLYNVCNHILFYHFYDLVVSWEYILFVAIFAFFGVSYFIALWHMSEHEVYRDKKKASGTSEAQ